MNVLLAGLVAVLPLLAADPAPQFAAIQKLSGTVGFYAADGKHLGDTKVGAHPHEAALSPDGKTLYVSDNGVVWMTDTGDGENTVSIVDVASRKRTGVIDLGSYRRPHGITVDPKTGYLLVTTEKPNALLRIDPASRKTLQHWDVKGLAPHMVVLNSTGEWAFTSDSNSGELSVINVRTGVVKVIAAGKRPQGQAFSPDGRTLYVTLADEASIGIFDVAKMAFTGRVPTGKTPVRVAVTPDGKTLVYALQEANAVGFADVALRRQVAEVPCGGPTMSMSLSRDGKLAYTGIQEQDKAIEISVADQKVVRTITAPKGSGPDPIIVLR
ncbi:MAG: beta-propeller repeat protein [Bryobacterales bacterium]|nr:beta-propeller repeat protein [Bryobacterales bacterium]